MLKHVGNIFDAYMKNQPPSGGCVLKLRHQMCGRMDWFQPPSGGCVLKQGAGKNGGIIQTPAAFRRLCVETK